MVANELEKLVLFVGEKKRITLGDVETMVLAAKQRSFYELTDAISARDRERALEVLDAILSTGDGEEAAIGHLYMLSRTFRQMLVILERNVRDSRALWQALWQGFRLPPFAAEDVIKQARRYKSQARVDQRDPQGRPCRSCAAFQCCQQATGAGKPGTRLDRRAEAAGGRLAARRTACVAGNMDVERIATYRVRRTASALA